MYDYVWLYMTLYERKRERKEREREREREQEQLKKKIIFSNFQNCSNNLNFFTRFYCSETFHTFQQTSTLFKFVYLSLPLLTFVYLCLPLFTLVQLRHLCTNFVLVTYYLMLASLYLLDDICHLILFT